MPAISHDAIVPSNGDLQSMKAQTAALNNHLAQINTHFAKLPTVNPGPPGDGDLIANIQKIINLAAQLQSAGNAWLQGTQ